MCLDRGGEKGAGTPRQSSIRANLQDLVRTNYFMV